MVKPNPAPNLVDAACATHPNPEWWTPRDARDPAIPAAVACEAWATTARPDAGVWGGVFRGGWA